MLVVEDYPSRVKLYAVLEKMRLDFVEMSGRQLFIKPVYGYKQLLNTLFTAFFLYFLKL